MKYWGTQTLLCPISFTINTYPHTRSAYWCKKYYWDIVSICNIYYDIHGSAKIAHYLKHMEPTITFKHIQILIATILSVYYSSVRFAFWALTAYVLLIGWCHAPKQDSMFHWKVPSSSGKLTMITQPRHLNINQVWLVVNHDISRDSSC